LVYVKLITSPTVYIFKSSVIFVSLIMKSKNLQYLEDSEKYMVKNENHS
jgi:hypothetical protein